MAWMFERKGQIYLDAEKCEEDQALEAALEAGADDMGQEGDQYVISTAAASLHTVNDALKKAGVQVEEAEIAMMPNTMVEVAGKDGEKLLKLMEALEDQDDVSKVFSNFDIDAETLAAANE